jgi:galactokinase/mevalonate kinase-like predicted kinase
MSMAEASAPVRVDLAGWPLDHGPLPLLRSDAGVVSVAIDRRAWCRVETLSRGLRLESKDTLAKTEVSCTSEVGGASVLALVARALEAVGVETGVAVTTQSRVPEDTGLGGAASLRLCVAAAAARATGRELDPDGLVEGLVAAEMRHMRLPAGVAAVIAAMRGGVVSVHFPTGSPRAQRLQTDPARVEECLTLFDSGGHPPAASPSSSSAWRAIKGEIEGDRLVRDALGTIASGAASVQEHLLAHRYAAVTEVLVEDWESRKRLRTEPVSEELERIVESARSRGGAASPCGDGRIVAVWSPVERREAVLEAVRRTGSRPLACRVDLRGLEVE